MLQLTFMRQEIKYLLTDEQRERLARLMDQHMVPDEWGASTVCNVYYDTPSHLLVRRSAEHPLYKEKVRVRSYGEHRAGDPVFVELKKKYDGIVYKRRCTMDERRAADLLAGRGEPQGQIECELDFTYRRYGGLVPSFFVAYDREAFYNPCDHEFRMTFDRRVRSRTDELRLAEPDRADLLLEDGLSILEVKAGGAMPLWLAEFFSGEGIFKARFSKVGMAWQRELGRELAQRRRIAERHEKTQSAALPVPACAGLVTC